MNILFVCSRNKWRSLTAEKIFANTLTHPVRSAGTEPTARVRINEKLINWADAILVMEQKHKRRIIERFPDLLDGKRIEVLEIEDNYGFMDKELIEILEQSVHYFLEEHA